MANNRNRNQKDLKTWTIILLCMLAIIAVIVILFKILNKKKDPQVIADQINIQYNENKNQSIVKDLSGMTEQERMTYYCGEFFKLIDSHQYEMAYELLYAPYRNTYFPTLASFQKYFQNYFPGDFSLEYANMERLGSIYVMWLDIKDTVNGSTYGHNFSMYAVLKENNYNDYEISFSKNSAVDVEEEEQ